VIPKALANVIVVIVAVIWVCNFFAQFVIHNYQPDPSINGVFGAIVGGALALTQRGKDNPPPAGRPEDPAPGGDHP
jgi:hypothetical protein